LFEVRVGSQTINSADTSSGAGLLAVVHFRNHLIGDSIAHFCNDVIYVGSTLREYVCGTYLENGQHEWPGISGKPALWNSRLESTSHTRHDEILVNTNVVCGILFPSHAHSWIRDGLSPATICHTNKPSLVIYGVVVVGVRLVNLRVLWC